MRYFSKGEAEFDVSRRGKVLPDNRLDGIEGTNSVRRKPDDGSKLMDHVVERHYVKGGEGEEDADEGCN